MSFSLSDGNMTPRQKKQKYNGIKGDEKGHPWKHVMKYREDKGNKMKVMGGWKRKEDKERNF